MSGLQWDRRRRRDRAGGKATSTRRTPRNDRTSLRIAEVITPLRIVIENGSRQPLQIRYSSFKLVGSRGDNYRAIPPRRVTGVVDTEEYIRPGFIVRSPACDRLPTLTGVWAWRLTERNAPSKTPSTISPHCAVGLALCVAQWFVGSFDI